jgi:hypothetical protein
LPPSPTQKEESITAEGAEGRRGKEKKEIHSELTKSRRKKDEVNVIKSSYFMIS